MSRPGVNVRVFTTIPTEQELRAAALGTTLRPEPKQPKVVTHGCYVVANVAGWVRGWTAGAIYYQPPRAVPASVEAVQGPQPGTLVLVLAERVAGSPAPSWFVGMVGEITGEVPPAWTGR